MAGGVGVLALQAWWRPLVVASAIFSTLLYIAFWDGAFQRLPDKGGVAILINLAILIAVLVLRWPRLGV